MKVISLLKNKHLANWNEKYLTQLGYFFHVNPGLKVSHSGETSHYNEGYNGLRRFPRHLQDVLTRHLLQDFFKMSVFKTSSQARLEDVLEDEKLLC